MSSVKRAFLWYYLLTKRLVKKASFVAILLLIPVCTLLLTTAAKQESAFYRVAVCAQDEADQLSCDVINELVNQKSKVVIIKEYKNESESIQAVKSGEVDSAWIFKSNLKNKISSFLKGNDTTPVKAYSKEPNIFEKLAKEKLYNALYPHISFELYSSSVNEHLLEDKKIDDETLKEYYYQFFSANSIIDFTFMESNQNDVQNTNLLTSPVRGILCVLILLCALSASMYFAVDDENGNYSNLDNKKKSFVLMLNILSAASVSAVAATLSILISGAYTSFFKETIMMILLVVMTTLFCYILSIFFNTPEKISVMMPVVLIVAIAFCPVFINTAVAKWFSVLLPPYLYLYGINNANYIYYMMIYVVVALSLCCVVTPLKQKFSKK